MKVETLSKNLQETISVLFIWAQQTGHSFLDSNHLKKHCLHANPEHFGHKNGFNTIL